MPFPNGNLFPSEILQLTSAYESHRDKSVTSITPGATAAAIFAFAQSGGDVTNTKQKSDGTTGYGLFQLSPEMMQKDGGLYGGSSAELLKTKDGNVAAAYQLSNGWKDFTPWYIGSTIPAGLDSTASVYQVAVNQINDANILGTVRPESFWDDVKAVGGVVATGVVGAGKAAVGLVTNLASWGEGLRQIFQHLLDPTWWKRIGIGFAGVAAILGALTLVFKDDIAKAVI
jgi:hypothetical protein